MSLGKRIIVDIHYDQKRVAIMEDGELAEFYMEDDENQGLAEHIPRQGGNYYQECRRLCG